MSKEDTKSEVVESASATTSPDNSNSGPFAYIIIGVTLAIVLVLSLIGAGCTSTIITAAAQHYTSTSTYSHDPYSDMLDDLYDDDSLSFEEWLDRYSYGMDGYGGPSNEGPVTVSVGDALDYDLSAYSLNIDQKVSASAYAGTPDAVRDFVRTLLSVDADCTNRLAACLNVAATDEAARADKLNEAKAICDEAHNAINDLALPELENDSNGEVKDLLGTAKDHAIKRWDSLREELDLLSATEVDKSKLWELDNQVTAATTDAGTQLENAMSRAASL